jgi:hypothetical protein
MFLISACHHAHCLHNPACHSTNKMVNCGKRRRQL